MHFRIHFHSLQNTARSLVVLMAQTGYICLTFLDLSDIKNICGLLVSREPRYCSYHHHGSCHGWYHVYHMYHITVQKLTYKSSTYTTRVQGTFTLKPSAHDLSPQSRDPSLRADAFSSIHPHCLEETDDATSTQRSLLHSCIDLLRPTLLQCIKQSFTLFTS